jgi:hypothetical protein
VGITPHGKQVSTPDEGVNVTSDLPPTLHILLKKTPPKNNIVIGEDRAPIRFLEHRLSTDAIKVEAVRVERVTDDMLAAYEGKLYHVSVKHTVDRSPELRGRTGVWTADPIVKGSAAINTLVKLAATRIVTLYGGVSTLHSKRRTKRHCDSYAGPLVL